MQLQSSYVGPNLCQSSFSQDEPRLRRHVGQIALACKAGGDNLTVEANDALQMGYDAESIDRPASPKVPIKHEARKRFFLLKVRLCIKYVLKALQSFARN